MVVSASSGVGVSEGSGALLDEICVVADSVWH